MIDQNTKYEGGMSDEQFGNLLAHLGRMEKENPMPKMETPRGGPEGTDKAITLPSIALRFSHGLSKAVGYHGTAQDRAEAITKKGFRYRLKTGKAAFGNGLDDDLASVVPGGYVAKKASQPLSLAHHSKKGDHAVAVVGFDPHKATADEDHSNDHLYHFSNIASHQEPDHYKQQKYFPPESLDHAEAHLAAAHSGEQKPYVAGQPYHRKPDSGPYRHLMSMEPEQRRRVLDLSRRFHNLGAKEPTFNPETRRSEPAKDVPREVYTHPSHPTGNAVMGFKHAMAKEIGGHDSWEHHGTAVVPEDAPHMIHGVIHIPRQDGPAYQTKSGITKNKPEDYKAYQERTADLHHVLDQHHETPEHAFKAVEALGGKYRVERNPLAAQHAGMAKGVGGMAPGMACGYAAAVVAGQERIHKAVRHEGAGQTEMNLVTGKTVRGGQFAPSPTAGKTPAAKVAAAPATPLTPTQEKQVQTALTSGQAEIAKDGTKYALKVKPAGNTRFRAVGTFKTMREAKAAVLPALGVEGKGAKVTAYQDVGAKIGGARKDIASARTKFEDNPTEDGLTALEGEDPAAASRAVKKSVLWPISSVDDMKAKGADPDSIYVAHALHSLISPKPEIDTAGGRAHYFAGVATLRAFVEGSASFEALSERLRGLSADYRTASHAAYDEYRKARGMRASYDEPCTLYQAEIGVQVAALGSRFHKFMGGKDTKVKGRDVYPLSLFRDGMGSHVKPERKWQIVHDAFGGGGETSTETVAGPKAKSVDDLDIAAERERLKQWERTAPTTYERKGGKVATIRRPEEYLKAFGLRGVEFGTYMDDDASRLHVDRCAEAFQDLADVLGISSKELSMNGRLALAFGARGSGGASAHYEPHKVVINLTKLGGAGALAHEWTHFFDHTLQRVESGNANSMDYLSKAGITRGQELTDVQKAMVGVMEKIYHGGGHMKYLPTPKATSGFASTVDMYLSRHGNDPQKALDAVFKTYSGTSLSKLKDMADYMAHKTGAKQIDLPTKGSEYHGRMLRAGEYWARPQEMFARCMEAYVQDALTSKKRMNNYLVRETKKDEDSPLPRGEQRKSINAAIGVLLQAVRDGGTLKKALRMDTSPFDALEKGWSAFGGGSE